MDESIKVPQPEPIKGGMPEPTEINYFLSDPHIHFLLAHYVNDDYQLVKDKLIELGDRANNEIDPLSREADRHPPTLTMYDKRGQRINDVNYHSSYSRLEEIGYEEFGLVAMSHRSGVMGAETAFNKVMKYTFWYVFAQAEFGLCCPMSMTDSAAKILEDYGSVKLKKEYLPQLISTKSDRMTAAQFMTEKQGGSDVGANSVRAEANGDSWLITGDKWFCSNVSADVALVLARPTGAKEGTKGLAMFLVPRILPSGERNHYTINKLKDKLGTKGMASGEVTFERATGYLVGELDHGFKQMMSMVNASRLSNSVRSTGLIRRSYLEALYTTRGRIAFKKPLAKLPLMQKQLFEMMLTSEVATSMSLYTAHTFDLTETKKDEKAKTMLRLLTPLLKGVICKQARVIAGESMEMRGGNGYIEEWANAKLVRDAHLGSIWEGTTNIVALDVLRAITKNKANTVLIQTMKTILNEVTFVDFTPLRKKLLTNMHLLEEDLNLIGQVSPTEVEMEAISIMQRIYYLLANCLLLKEAEIETKETSSYRKYFNACYYYHLHIQESKCRCFHQSVWQWGEDVINWVIIPKSAISHFNEQLSK
ncbi:acyl-CoA dehydrogenase family protein [Cytobacillus kochii]|uniref:acyl-CoA dehydrogenase family protein n=1 Tax=Cytobacillus kochii TaxID=859143 RepID=UPI002E1D6C25|nr:acyl-CoA dehydrogenase family protein [Cytobacillus kochii]MED1606731.1 acyl-CoA dehydrogenase family protein [Cytobacillus kochii]